MNDVATKETKPSAEAKMGAHIEGVSTDRRFPRAGKLRIVETLIKCPKCKEPNRMRLFEDLKNPICQVCGEPFGLDLSDDYWRRKYGYPTSHEYFRFVPESGYEHLAKRFTKTYGKKPTVISAYLPLWPEGSGRIPTYPEMLRRLFYQSYQLLGASGRKCEGDGITARRLDEETGEHETVECYGRACLAFQEGDCRMRATLNLFLPCLGQPVIVQFDTGSANNIVEINSALELLYAMTGGDMYRPIGLRVEIAHTRRGRSPFIHVVWPEELDLEPDETVVDRNLLAARDGLEPAPEPEYVYVYDGEVPDEKNVRKRLVNDLYGLVAQINADEEILTDAGMADAVRAVDDAFTAETIDREGIYALDVAVIEGVLDELKRAYPDALKTYREKKVDRTFG